MSTNDAFAIEEFYEKKFSQARRRDFIGRMERKLHHKELRSDNDRS